METHNISLETKFIRINPIPPQTKAKAWVCFFPILLANGVRRKAKGIAKDLFGDDNGYVLPVQNLKKDDDLLQSFNWLVENEEKILEWYEKRMPEYKGIGEKSYQKILEKF